MMKSLSINLPRYFLSLLCSFLWSTCGWSWSSCVQFATNHRVLKISQHASTPALSRATRVLYAKLFAGMSYFDEDNEDDNPRQFWDKMDDDMAQKPGQVPVNDNRISDEELEASLTDWDDKIARFNTVHLVGRVGNDPEPRYFDDGKVVVNLSLASRRKYHYLERKAREIQSGEEETDWYGLEIWGQTAEYVSKFVDKGARVGVVGSLQVDTWTDRATGERREKAKVVVREFDLLETKAEADLRRNKGGGQSGRGGSSFYAGGSGSGSGSLGRDRFDEYNPSQGSSGGFFDS